jgi:hypothetical protein
VTSVTESPGVIADSSAMRPLGFLGSFTSSPATNRLVVSVREACVLEHWKTRPASGVKTAVAENVSPAV